MAKLRTPPPDQVLAFCAENPVERVFLEDLARRGLGRFLAVPQDGALEALCHFGANITPAGLGCGVFARRALTSDARMIVGAERAVDELWQEVAMHLPPPRRDSPGEPVYELRERPAPGASGLRLARSSDLELLVPSCAAAHEEELGINPLEHDPAIFRQRTRVQIVAGRSWLWDRERAPPLQSRGFGLDSVGGTAPAGLDRPGAARARLRRSGASRSLPAAARKHTAGLPLRSGRERTSDRALRVDRNAAGRLLPQHRPVADRYLAVHAQRVGDDRSESVSWKRRERGGCEIFRAMRRMVSLTLLVAATALVAPNPALATRSSKIAALQVALWQKGFYRGNVSGIANRATVRGVKRLQRVAGLTADGIVGPKTRPFLGKLHGPRLGSRTLRRGLVGGDVAELQFLLAEHGFPSARFDGVMGAHTVAALRRFERFAGLVVNGRAGPNTLAALAQPPPRAPAAVFDWPLKAPISSVFGPRGDCFHAGIDFAVSAGTPVRAAAAGTVVFAGPGGNFGLLVVIAHSGELRSYYAHLSRVDARYGQKLKAGARIGLSGESGQASGPNLHFELRLRGAAVDPLPALR